MLEQAWRLFRNDIAIDLGSSKTRLYVQGRGLALEEPTLVVTQTQGNKQSMVAFGKDAQQYEGRTPPNMTVHHPVTNSVCTNSTLLEGFLRYAIQQSSGGNGLLRPKILLVMPHNLGNSDKKNLIDVLYRLGNRDSVYVDTLLCSGLGAKLPINEPMGSLLLHIGHGTTQVGVLTLSGLAVQGRSNIAGATLNQAIVQHLKTHKNIEVSEFAAQEIKNSIGQAYPTGDVRTMRTMGRDLLSGQVRTVELSSSELIDGIQPTLRKIAGALKHTIRSLSSELCADILESGLMVTGGSAQMPGIDDFLSAELGIPVFVAERPHLTSILGAGELLSNADLLDWLGEESD